MGTREPSARGRVFLVGAGPGDPGLLTLRAAEVLESAEVLLYDALASDAIVTLAPATCERIYVGKRAGDHAMPQDEIERLAIARAQTGSRVVRLKGGDPFIFGRGGEEAQAFAAARVSFEIVPGVSSAYAVPAYAGIPVTHREFAASFTVATGHEDPGKAVSSLDWAKLADPQRTLVLLMATANLGEIAKQLIAHGLAPQTPVAVVQDGTRPSQRTVLGRLDSIAGDIAAAKIGAPAVVVVGGVAALRTQLRWFDTGALFGKRVLITRAGEQSSEFARALLARGAQPIVAPTIAIAPLDDTSAADRAIDGSRIVRLADLHIAKRRRCLLCKARCEKRRCPLDRRNEGRRNRRTHGGALALARRDRRPHAGRSLSARRSHRRSSPEVLPATACCSTARKTRATCCRKCCRMPD